MRLSRWKWRYWRDYSANKPFVVCNIPMPVSVWQLILVHLFFLKTEMVHV